MLTTLRIKNLALVSDLTLELQPGFNAITGETGAGKSIILGALNLVLGQRADRTLIRSGCDSCTVEAVFETKELASLPMFLEENGLEPCLDGQLILKRTFTAAGANRQFVNGSPTSLNVLADLSELLVDIHGPHDHQSLLHATKQLAILDAFGGLAPTREGFAQQLKRRQELLDAKAALIVDEQTYAQQVDLLRFQVAEITAARLRGDEEEQLEIEHRRASNAAKLLEHSQAALGVLNEDEQSVMNVVGALGRSLHELQRLDPGANCLLSLHKQSVDSLRDLLSDLSHYADRIDLDPARLQELDERLNLIHSLKRKYGSTLDAVIAYGDEAREKLRQLESRDAELERIHNELRQLDSTLEKLGKELSAQRRKLIPRLSKAVVQQLNDLGFKQSDFQISLNSVATPAEATATGMDTIEFLFAPNLGEPARPLRAIASSGEMARVMLALKTVLAAEDEIPVLVFDEVDANVGGETAHAVGQKMQQIGARRQALCITHLAPVAAAANAHYVVSKQVREGRTISEIELLDESHRVSELARMLGGQEAAVRKHAEALLQSARKRNG